MEFLSEERLQVDDQLDEARETIEQLLSDQPRGFDELISEAVTESHLPEATVVAAIWELIDDRSAQLSPDLKVTG